MTEDEFRYKEVYRHPAQGLENLHPSDALVEENKRLRYEIEKLSVLKNACQTVVCDREVLGCDGIYNVIRRAWIDYNLNDRGEP